MSIFSRRLHFSKNSSRGFTLIELLAVVAIMVVITSVLLLRQSQFNSSTLLRSLSYGVALSVRTAQVYGTTIFGTTTTQANCTVTGAYDTTTGNCFAPGYGIYFSDGDATSNPPQYRLFADLNNNGKYDASPDETIHVYKIGKGYQMSQFCAGRIVGSIQDCWQSGGGGALTSLSVIFRRPNPDACFSTTGTPPGHNPDACGTGTAVYASSSVQIVSGDDTRTIVMTTTGQITVCPLNRAC